jgi:hypothetical protein|eukprot:15919094-Heterocapsa_arctica.AAC.1
MHDGLLKPFDGADPRDMRVCQPHGLHPLLAEDNPPVDLPLRLAGLLAAEGNELLGSPSALPVSRQLQRSIDCPVTLARLFAELRTPAASSKWERKSTRRA